MRRINNLKLVSLSVWVGMEAKGPDTGEGRGMVEEFGGL